MPKSSRAGGPGVVVAVEEDEIVAQARRAGVVVAVVPRVGDFVPAGAPLFRICAPWPDGPRDPDDDRLADRLAGLVTLSNERSLEQQDLAFSFRQLVDIAEKALSPGVNDPTTAAQ